MIVDKGTFEKQFALLTESQSQTGISLSHDETSILLQVIDRFGEKPQDFIKLKESGFSEERSWATPEDRWNIIDYLLAGWAFYSDLLDTKKYNQDYVKCLLGVAFHQMFYASDNDEEIAFYYKIEKRVPKLMIVLRVYANNVRILKQQKEA